MVWKGRRSDGVMTPDWVGVAALLLIITTITAVGYFEGHSML
jgi:hypothetical protein